MNCVTDYHSLATMGVRNGVGQYRLPQTLEIHRCGYLWLKDVMFFHLASGNIHACVLSLGKLEFRRSLVDLGDPGHRPSPRIPSLRSFVCRH